MNKPLELIVYETDDETGRYMCADGVTYAAEAVDEFADWKRLTDTELAAEYWRAEWTTQYDANRAPGDEQYELRESAKTQTLHRFATTPHYREESA